MARIGGSVAQREDSYSFYIDWSETVDTANNRSTVTATAYIYCSAHTAYASNLAQSLTIDGTVFTNTVNVNLSSGVVVALVSGSKTIAHDNNGNKSIVISADCALPNGNGWGPSWGSAYAEVGLTSIARHAVLQLNSVTNIGLDSVTVNYKHVSGQFYYLQYRLGNGNWDYISGVATFNLGGLKPGTEYSIQIRGISQDKSLVGAASNTLKFKTKAIAHGSIDSNILYFPGTIPINITNEANATVTAFVFLDATKIKEVTLKTGNNAIDFTEEEKKEIYKSLIKNQTNIKIVVRTNNKYESTAIEKTLTFTGEWKSIYDKETKKKGQLWAREEKKDKLKKAIIWSNINKGGTPIWKKAI